MAPIDGKEYAAHAQTAKSKQAKSKSKKKTQLARNDHGGAKAGKKTKVAAASPSTKKGTTSPRPVLASLKRN